MLRCSLLVLVLLPFWAGACGDSEPNRIRLFESQAPPTAEVLCQPEVVCAAPTPYCFGSLCVACLTDKNCGNKFCEPSSHTCVDCVTSGDCKNDKPYCSKSQCRQCVVGENCGDPGLNCDQRDGKCVPRCKSELDCVGAKPACAPEAAICVECSVNTDCPKERPWCHESACVQCTSPDECDAMRPVCDLEKLECVECSADTDCPGYGVCDMRKCVE